MIPAPILEGTNEYLAFLSKASGGIGNLMKLSDPDFTATENFECFINLTMRDYVLYVAK